MGQKIDTTKWTYEEFLGFILLYAANADITIAEQEKKMIENKVGQEQFEKAKSWFNKSNDYERLQAILSLKPRFYPTEEEKKKIIKNIQEVFLADGKFDQVEKSLLLCLQRFM